MTRPRRLPDVLTPEERQILLDQKNLPPVNGLRNHLLIRLMLNTGMRSAEILNLEIKNCDLKTGRVKVRGKGKRDRTLYLSEDDTALLCQYLDLQNRSHELVFRSRTGRGIQPRYLRQMVKRVARSLGIEKDVHPHMLRHTFATDLYRQTANLRLTQKALGHSSITTTEIYTHIVDSELEEAMKGLRA